MFMIWNKKKYLFLSLFRDSFYIWLNLYNLF